MGYNNLRYNRILKTYIKKDKDNNWIKQLNSMVWINTTEYERKIIRLTPFFK